MEYDITLQICSCRCVIVSYFCEQFTLIVHLMVNNFIRFVESCFSVKPVFVAAVEHITRINTQLSWLDEGCLQESVLKQKTLLTINIILKKVQ